jgi:hypothetical protein
MNNSKVTQLSLFPARKSVKQVIAEGKAKLPITTENELIALLELHQNTILSLQTQETPWLI